jgi:MSHA pilin protein MshA
MNNLIKNDGFTLVELVLTIVILASLAATALPKLINLGASARIATLNSFAGAIESAAYIGRTSCLANSQCITKITAICPTDNSLVINGKTIYFYGGFPSGWGRCTVDDNNGFIGDLLSYSGFTALPHVGGTAEAVFTLNGSPTPSNCKVTYKLFASASPLITTTTTGC